MKILNRYIYILVIIFIFNLLSACNDKKEIILDIVYKDTAVNVQSVTSAFELDSTIFLNCTITNNEEQNLYIPIAFFQIQSSIGGGRMLMTSPDNTFDKTYIYNTIYIYPRNMSISSLSHMNGGTVTDRMPNFIRIKPHESSSFHISFPNEYINNGIKRKRLIDSLQYTAHMKIAIIKERKFIQLLKLISVYKHLEKFVKYNDTLRIASTKMNMVLNESLQLSEIKIDEFQSLVINEICNVKVDFIFDIEKLNDK